MIYKSKPSDFNKKFDIVGCFVQYKGKFILLRRQMHKSNGGMWGLPAGKREGNENIEQAVLREIKEETGLEISSPLIDYFSSSYVRDNAIDIRWHMFSANFDVQPQVIINSEEHSEFKWITPQEALKMENLIHDLRESIELFYKPSTEIL